MVYSDIVNSGLILPIKQKYNLKDVKSVMLQSLFCPVSGQTLSLKQSCFVVICSAAFHDTDYSNSVAKLRSKLIDRII